MTTGWTQEEAIEYECACECITDLMGIKTAEICEEEAKPFPDTTHVARLRAERFELAQERKRLHADNHAEIARINKEYGAIVRAAYARQEAIPA